jgi:hypothetical protein
MYVLQVAALYSKLGHLEDKDVTPFINIKQIRVRKEVVEIGKL